MKTKLIGILCLLLISFFCFNCENKTRSQIGTEDLNCKDSLLIYKERVDSLQSINKRLMQSIMRDLDSLKGGNEKDAGFSQDFYKKFDSQLSKYEKLSEFILYENATVKFKLEKDPGLNKVSVNIGGVEADLSKDKVEGVYIFSGGQILTNVTVKQGVGNYTLTLSDVQLEPNGKKNKVEPSSGEKVPVDGYIRKNHTYTVKQ